MGASWAKDIRELSTLSVIFSKLENHSKIRRFCTKKKYSGLFTETSMALRGQVRHEQ